MQTDVMKRLLCEKSFEKMISDIAGMTLQTLKEYLERIKRYDDEIEPKLIMLGVSQEKIKQKRTELIGHNKIATLYSFAKLLENGMCSLVV